MKHVYKITPVSMYDVRGLESWLEDMAKRGLVLNRFRPLFCTFAHGPAQPARYRVEPYRRVMDDALPQAMLDLYQDFGWDFACDTADLLIFTTQDPNAPEPHSDPELQGALWKKLYRSKRLGLLISLVLNLVIAVSAGMTLFQNGTPVLNLLTTSVLWMFVVWAALLYSLPREWADVKRLGLIAQQLEAGTPLDHRTVYPRRRWSGAVYTALAIVLLILLAVSQYVLPFTGSGVRPLDELTAFPALSLAQVEGQGYEPHTIVMNGRNYGNFCDLTHYLLCWEQWEVVQSGETGPDSRVRMEIQWYDLPGWLSFLSAPLARELLDEAMGLKRDVWWTDEAQDRVWRVSYYPREEVPLLAAASNGPGGFQLAAAASGDKAVLVTYTGNCDLAEHLEEIMDMVK